MIIPPSPMDLTTLSACLSWAGIAGQSTNNNIQACLTAASIQFLRLTGRGPRNWQNATQNPFNEPVDYVETYDGNVGQKLFLRNFPINSIASLTVGGFTVPQFTGPLSPGYTVDDQGRSIAMILGATVGGAFSGRGYGYQTRYSYGSRPFASGVQSINVSYNAGFTTFGVVDELYTILPAWQASHGYSTGDRISDGTYIQQALNSGQSSVLAPPWSQKNGQPTQDNEVKWSNTGIQAAPYTITVQNDRATLADNGVKFFSNGNSLTPVLIQPTTGQYFLISQGTYLFAAADAGQQVMISYTAAGTPADIILAIMQLVALNYKRRDWVGQRSVAMKDVGSTSYTLDMDPNIRDCIRNYTRNNISG